MKIRDKYSFTQSTQRRGEYKNAEWYNFYSKYFFANFASLRDIDFSRFLFLCLGAITFTACQRVIQIDLNTAASKVVIEAYVTDQLGIDTVKLSRTGSYFDQIAFPKINSALVIISDNTGVTDTLTQVDSGAYANSNLQGIPGRTYSLKVFSDGKEYDAVSTMPQPVNIDTVVAQYRAPGPGVTNPGYRIRCYFQDPPGMGNFYRVQLTVNGYLKNGPSNISIAQDKFQDGTEISIGLRGETLSVGDTARVDLMSIDANTYNYFNVLRSVTNQGNPISTTTPQNPPSNIVGDGLGYFAAYPMRTRVIVAQ